MKKANLWALLVVLFFVVIINRFYKKHPFEIESYQGFATVSLPTEKQIPPQKTYFGVFENSYLAFCNQLGSQESSNNYKAVNRFGYLGKYQFSTATLQWLGVNDTQYFLNSPLLQEAALKALIAKNKYLLQDHLGNKGCRINGLEITDSGLIAAAHLAGVGNVKRFLQSNGKYVFKDGNKVPITKYIKQFAHYDLTAIAPNKNAVASL